MLSLHVKYSQAQRIGSSFALLKGDAAVQLHNRIVAEEKAVLFIYSNIALLAVVLC